MREDISEMKLTIKRGQETIATVEDRLVVLSDEFSPEGQLVRSIISIGVPVPKHMSQERWRIPVEDPDFKEALEDHLSQYGLEVI